MLSSKIELIFVFIFIIILTSVMSSNISSFLERNESSVWIGIHHKLIQRSGSLESQYLVFRNDSKQMFEMKIELNDNNDVIACLANESKEWNYYKKTRMLTIISKEEQVHTCKVSLIHSIEEDYKNYRGNRKLFSNVFFTKSINFIQLKYLKTQCSQLIAMVYITFVLINLLVL